MVCVGGVCVSILCIYTYTEVGNGSSTLLVGLGTKNCKTKMAETFSSKINIVSF